MPPRKSDASKVATGDEGASVEKGTPAKKEDGINIEDLNLPKSIVTRLAKGVLPPNTQIQGNAMLALSKSATVFVNYVATHANEYAQTANRKTVAPTDVFKALDDLEFDFKDRLEAELAKFNEIQTDKRNTYRKRVAAEKAAKGGSPGPVEGENRNGPGDDEGNGEPKAKKARMDPDAPAAEGEEDDIVDEGDLGEETMVEEAEGEGEGEAEEETVEDDIIEEEEEADEPPEDALEEPEERDEGDEALDNGEDSE